MMTESLRQFVLVGESAGSNAAVKQVKVVAAAPPPTPSGTLTVTIHVMQDTTAALASELQCLWNVQICRIELTRKNRSVSTECESS